jgi:putative intracellular protease/amidase
MANAMTDEIGMKYEGPCRAARWRHGSPIFRICGQPGLFFQMGEWDGKQHATHFCRRHRAAARRGVTVWIVQGVTGVWTADPTVAA